MKGEKIMIFMVILGIVALLIFCVGLTNDIGEDHNNDY